MLEVWELPMQSGSPSDENGTSRTTSTLKYHAVTTSRGAPPPPPTSLVSLVTIVA